MSETHPTRITGVLGCPITSLHSREYSVLTMYVGFSCHTNIEKSNSIFIYICQVVKLDLDAVNFWLLKKVTPDLDLNLNLWTRSKSGQ